MSRSATKPASVAAVLFGRGRPFDNANRRADALAARLSRLKLIDLGTTTAALSPLARQLVSTQIAGVLASLFDLDLSQLVLTAWRTHSALREAARSTLADPAARRVVDLATHRITSTHQPYVDLLIDGVEVGRIELVLTMELVVTELAAVVSRGRLVSLESGRSTVTAVLSVAGVEAIRRQRHIDLAVVVRLGDGIPILPEPERPSPRGLWTTKSS